MMANARTASQRMSFTFLITTTGNSAYQRSGTSRRFINTSSKRCSSGQTAGIGEFIAAMGFIRSLYGIDSFRERRSHPEVTPGKRGNRPCEVMGRDLSGFPTNQELARSLDI